MSSTAHKRVALAAATVMLGGTGLLAAAAPVQAQSAHAATASRPATAHSASAKWRLLWGPATFRPKSKTWKSNTFRISTGVTTFGTNFRCWNGGDGTKMKAEIYDYSRSKTIARTGWYYCDGGWKTLITDEAHSTHRYRVVLIQKGSHGVHTESVKAYEYR